MIEAPAFAEHFGVSIDLSHIGEALVQQLIQRKPSEFLQLCSIEHAQLHGDCVHRELALRPYNGRTFDGASRVDLTLPLGVTEALAIEVKLGTEGLSKRRIDGEWLSGCRESHNGRRWAGNMMSILERRFPHPESEGTLSVFNRSSEYVLTKSWCLIVRRKVAKSWIDAGKPDFRNAIIITFEELVRMYERDEFDAIVRSLLSFPYFDTWIGDAE